MADELAPGELLGDLGSLALFLDLDGTLLPIAPTPEAARPSPDLPRLLGAAAARLGGALAIVSGREIAAIEQLTGNAVDYLAGGHGAEFRLGRGQVPLRPAPQPEIGDLAHAVQRLAERWPELLIEPKQAGIAVHYRRAPHLREPARAAIEALLAAQRRADLAVLQGDHVLEIRSPAHNKGAAMRRLMAELPFHGRRPAFIGDDVTDEDAFAVALEMDGLAIVVGARQPSIAAHRLASHDAVLRLLARLGG